MATLANGTSNAESSRRDISVELQSKDLPSRRLLGKGLSGIAYETAWNGERYARKDFVGVQRDIFVQEATVLVGLKDHKNIVKTYGWTVDKRSCSLVLEYMEEDLLSLLQKRMDSKRGVVGKDLGKQSSSSTCTQPVDLPEAVDMMLQIATGVEYLHEQGLAHGDLKTKNILVTHRKDGDRSSNVLKLSDFGLVGTKRKSRYIVSRQVRKLDLVRWKSPECLEILSRRVHSSNVDEDETSSESESESTPSSVPEVSSACAVTKSSDVYSFAVICCQILTGHSPYPYVDWQELMDKILSGFRPALPVSCPPLLREVLISCWGDPAERPSFSSVRMKLIRVQGLLTTEMGKRPEESEPSVTDSPAHQAAVVPSTEVSSSSGNCLLPKPSKGPAIVPSEWAASVVTMRSNAPGVPSTASSAPPPPATAAASPAADESYEEILRILGAVPSSEPTQSEERSHLTLLRDSMAKFDPSVKRFSDRSPHLVTTNSDLHTDLTIGRDSNLADTSFLKEFFENEAVTSPICDTSSTEIKTGTTDTGSSFKAWQRTRVLLPSQRKREKSKNQWLLRRCFQNLPLQRALQQGIQTRGAVSQPRFRRDTGSEESTLTISAKSTPHCRALDNKALSHIERERKHRKRLNELFFALRGSVPEKSPLKGDRVSILGDAITYLDDLKEEIRSLKMNMDFMERRYETLLLSYQDLAQRNQLLEPNKSQVEHQYEDLILPHQNLQRRNKPRNKLLKATKNEVKNEYEEVKLSHQDLEQRNKLPEATKNEMKNEFEEVKSSHQDLEQRNKLSEATKNQVKNEYEVKLSPQDLEQRNKQLETIGDDLPDGTRRIFDLCREDEIYQGIQKGFKG